MSACSRHTACVKNALAQAETICQKQGARLTPVRKHVLEMVWRSHQPRKAYDLLSELMKHDTNAKPPTVYRALDFLQELGLVHKVESLNAYIGCDGTHAHQYLICESCGDVSDIHDDALAKAVQTKAGAKGFRVANIIEIKGHCGRC